MQIEPKKKGLNGVNYVAGPTGTEATLGKTHTTKAKDNESQHVIPIERSKETHFISHSFSDQSRELR